MDASQDVKERLSEDLKTIAEEAEDLIRARGTELAERTKEIRERLAVALETADETLAAIQSKAKEGVNTADRAIREHPYESLGVALGVGIAIGLFLKRK